MNGGIIHVLLEFAFFYPLAMSLLWMSGGLLYFLRWERKEPARAKPPALASYPMVSLIVPCHNEGEQVRETIAQLSEQSWPDFEIIAVNDGSTDDTGEKLDQLMNEYPQLRVIHLSSNQGKAMGLRTATLAAKGDYLVCVDGDAMLDRYATHWLMTHLLSSARVGAVTGNPRIRNRSTLLGKLQVGEFSSIIGLIKRAQRVYGRIFTVSGVIAAFRKVALHDVGYWNTDMVTEDIDVSWRLQMRHWEIRYEPNALCWILMPETLRGLWKQRLRWAQGGSEVLLRYWSKLLHWRQRRMWMVAAEYVVSLIWSYDMVAMVMLWLLGLIITLPPSLHVPTLLPQWNGVVLGIVCMLQFLISLLIDRRYEKRIGRNYYWMIWYPIAYWMLTTATSVVALPRAVIKRRGTRAVWTSPDRGVR
ncbi:poly-beta-1,6-N-acetyl-D-glucosamine synthase [Dyella caseinilytica]|uniref:Poly-beta-1,6-N-acetyl-D-glucosamine synthase n=1 Tax=Dyella caseinilytica TaxID=1849581 RepID=A0ABX7GWX4_9GAMM|nr:poly-beta-1,6-N-acetyl-D-glucosamine synthase [Dyella caseinilytica]QRN54971.1 poly-beta-1,6 N-acetyl-D-glucosamine synthase [Dyella caseinilytica]GFZ98328.1 poly-beta-1,6 N-acetyl-D-glucosamine synthase [Dyella caseinilytica]